MKLLENKLHKRERDTCYTEVNLKSGKIFDVKSNVISTDVNTSVIQNITTPKFKIYPNPVNDKLTIEIINSQSCELVLSDIIGNQIFRQKLIDNRNEINLSGLEKGVYVVQLFDDKDVLQIRKIVKF